MTNLADYRDRYSNALFEREDGVLTVRFHTQGESLRWDAREGGSHDQLGQLFYDIGRDRDNKVIVLTGTGDVFLDSFYRAPDAPPLTMTTSVWDRIYKEGKDLLMNLLDIEVPVIGAVNGPAFIHAELLTMSDIVIASDKARFADKAHFPNGVVPGDGAHIWWEMVLGPTRSRYFLLTGQEIDARQALALGIVNEVVPHASLLERATELAHGIAAKPELARRYSRAAMTQNIKKRMLDGLGYGLMLEGLAQVRAG